MKAMCIDEKKNFVWQDVPDPVCHGEFDVKLKVEACAVNRADLMQRAGIYAPPEGWPLWPGLECTGVVLEAPAHGRFKPGDRVCALLGGGGYAEQVVVPEGMCLPLPKGFESWEATGIPEVYATAYLNLRIVGEIKRGETFFINGGEGGLGVACIQLAKHVFGALRRKGRGAGGERRERRVLQVGRRGRGQQPLHGRPCGDAEGESAGRRHRPRRRQADGSLLRDHEHAGAVDLARLHGRFRDDHRREPPLAQEPSTHWLDPAAALARGESADPRGA